MAVGQTVSRAKSKTLSCVLRVLRRAVRGNNGSKHTSSAGVFEDDYTRRNFESNDRFVVTPTSTGERDSGENVHRSLSRKSGRTASSCPFNTPVVPICPATDGIDIRLRDWSIGRFTEVTCKRGSQRAAYTFPA
jgi:hypothetical protein